MNRLIHHIVVVAVLCVFASSNTAGAADDVMQILSATYKIANSSSTATAFIVQRQSESGEPELILLTAAHVMDAMSGNECKLVLRMKSDDETYQRHEAPLGIREKGKQLWVRHPKADIAAMRIQLPPDHDVDPLRYDLILDADRCDDCEIEMGDDVWVFTFPNQLESSQSGFPVLRRGTVASFPLQVSAKRRTFMADYSTFAGDSGGPVFVRRKNAQGESQPIVVGLIHGQHRETVKSKTPNEERTVHRPMGLAIVVHAKLIRETIDQVP